jgi:hypothetical protein
MDSVIDPSTTPDALMVPNRHKRGSTLWARMNSILDIAEPLLGVDRSKGERAYIRNQGSNEGSFVTRDPCDTIGFPLNSPLRGRPRYDWIDGDGGIRRGFLKAEAKNFEAPAFDPIAAGVARRPGF